MSQITKQAGKTKSSFAGTFAKLVAVAILTTPLAGCMGTGLGFLGGPVDPGMTTSSTPRPKAPETISDETTIRNAVSSADLTKLDGQPLPWANTDTGSAGVVTGIRQINLDGMICRDFVTTNHSFSGVAKYQGRTCLTGNGEWKLITLDKQA